MTDAQWKRVFARAGQQEAPIRHTGDIVDEVADRRRWFNHRRR